jgi:hypothetical protein
MNLIALYVLNKMITRAIPPFASTANKLKGVPMNQLKYKPIPHDHQNFLIRARQRVGFQEAYDALKTKYGIIDNITAGPASHLNRVNMLACPQGSPDAETNRTQPEPDAPPNANVGVGCVECWREG